MVNGLIMCFCCSRVQFRLRSDIHDSSLDCLQDTPLTLISDDINIYLLLSLFLPRYKMHEDGVYRLQTIRYESIELTQQLLKDKIHLQGDASDSAAGTADGDASPDTSHIRTSTPEPEHMLNNSNEADFSYNLEMLGEVALTLPKGRFAQHMDSLQCDNKENEMDHDSEAGGENNCSEMELESNTGTSVIYSESEYAHSEYAQSEFGHSEYAASDSHYMGSERYAESEPDFDFSSCPDTRPGSSSAMSVNSRDRYGLPVDIPGTSSDMPPMMGPQAQCVDITSFAGTTIPALDMDGGHTQQPDDNHRLQPLPTNIEETTQLLSS